MRFGEQDVVLGIMAPEMGHLHEHLNLGAIRARRRELIYDTPWVVTPLENGRAAVTHFMWRTPKPPSTFYATVAEAETACQEAWLSLAMP